MADTYLGKYGMFTKAGDARVETLIKKTVMLPMKVSTKDLYSFLRTEIDRIAVKHGEVHDTAVRDAIAGAIEKATGRELSIYEFLTPGKEAE